MNQGFGLFLEGCKLNPQHRRDYAKGNEGGKPLSSAAQRGIFQRVGGEDSAEKNWFVVEDGEKA